RYRPVRSPPSALRGLRSGVGYPAIPRQWRQGTRNWPPQRGPPQNSEHRMERQEILERLKALIHERFGIDPAGISGKTTQAELGIASLLMVDMMLDVETELDMSFESMDLPRNPDMDTIVDLVKRNMDRGA